MERLPRALESDGRLNRAEGVHAMATSVRRAGSGDRVVSDPGAVVLEASVTPPRLRPEHIARPRLTALLGPGPTPKLLLVAAPPGYGKSTFLADWAATFEGQVGWLSLDEHDNDPARFFAGVIAALQRGGIDGRRTQHRGGPLSASRHGAAFPSTAA